MIKAQMKGIKIDKAKVLFSVKTASVEAFDKCALLVELVAKLSMKKGGARGRVGPRGGYIRQPSAPGTPPNVQRGALRASIAWARDGNTWVVGPTEKYGAVHEFGSRTHPRRPFMNPALNRAKSRFARFFKDLPLR